MIAWIMYCFGWSVDCGAQSCLAVGRSRRVWRFPGNSSFMRALRLASRSFCVIARPPRREQSVLYSVKWWPIRLHILLLSVVAQERLFLRGGGGSVA